MCEPIGEWVKPAHKGAIGRERKEEHGERTWKGPVCRMVIERAFFCSIRVWMRSFHNLCEKPSSMFMLLGWSSLFVLLPWWCIPYIWISWTRILVKWKWLQSPKFMLHLAMANFSVWYSLLCWWCSLILVSYSQEPTGWSIETIIKDHHWHFRLFTSREISCGQAQHKFGSLYPVSWNRYPDKEIQKYGMHNQEGNRDWAPSLHEWRRRFPLSKSWEPLIQVLKEWKKALYKHKWLTPSWFNSPTYFCFSEPSTTFPRGISYTALFFSLTANGLFTGRLHPLSSWLAHIFTPPTPVSYM